MSPAEDRPPAQLIRDALPTSRHAGMLFDMVVAELGELAIVESANGETLLSLYRRESSDSEAIVPWPLLRLGTKGRLSTVIDLPGPDGQVPERVPRPGRAPRLRNLGPGEIEFHDGPHCITVTYGEDGRWTETSRSQDRSAHAAVREALARGGAQATELLAAYVTTLDIGRHGPARILRPVPVPGGISHLFNIGLFGARDALFDERVPFDARCVVVDGFAGSCLAWGASPEEALDAWRRAVGRDQPAPPRPQEAEEPEFEAPAALDLPDDALGVHVRISGPVADVPWPDPSIATTPAVIIPLADAEQPANDWGVWTRLLGPHAESTLGLVQRDLDGCVIVGERLAERVDLDSLSGVMDTAEVRGSTPTIDGTRWPAHLPPLNSRVVTFQLLDEATHEPTEPRVIETRMTNGFMTREIDGVRIRWHVLRQRFESA